MSLNALDLILRLFQWLNLQLFYLENESNYIIYNLQTKMELIYIFLSGNIL